MFGYIYGTTGKLSALAPRVPAICQRIAPQKTDDGNAASALDQRDLSALRLLRQHVRRSSGKQFPQGNEPDLFFCVETAVSCARKPIRKPGGVNWSAFVTPRGRRSFQAARRSSASTRTPS